MNEGILKYQELLQTDEGFREKLKAGVEAYDGEQSEEAVFNNVLVPVTAEYGISFTYEEFKTYADGLIEKEIDRDELKQVVGGSGTGAGAGLVACLGLGAGVGGGGGSGAGAVCIVYGLGWGQFDCIGEGITSHV